MSSRVEEYRATYHRMADEELLELSGQLDQLTPDARIALWAEIGRRGITEQAAEAQDAAMSHDSSAAASHPSEPDLHAWSLLPEPSTLPSNEFVAVLSVGDVSEAQHAQELLHAKGIESQLQIVLLVPQANSEKALQIVSEQIDPGADLTEETAEDED